MNFFGSYTKIVHQRESSYNKILVNVLLTNDAYDIVNFQPYN